jgi:hypothetical protein
MKVKNNMSKKLTAALVAAGVLGSLQMDSASAQSTDSLLNKLVEKGVITKSEAAELRKESQTDFDKAYKAKTGMADWVSDLKFSGDFRPRYEGHWSDNDAAVQRDRFRLRLRLAATLTLRDNFEIGARLMTGESPSGFNTGNPLSGSTTFADNGSRKGIFVDQAYAKWYALKLPDWTANLTIGKMENPFSFSYVLFDPDYSPEGLAGQLAYKLDDHHSFKFVAGGFVLDELSADPADPYLAAAQLVWDAKWTEALQTSLGIGGLTITSQQKLSSANVPDIGRGNTRFPGGEGPTASFTPVVGDGSITFNAPAFPFYSGDHFPIKLGGEYVYNPREDMKNQAFMAGLTFGRAAKKGTWELSYQYRYVEANSWFEELPDDDFNAFYVEGANGVYRGGTNLRGHVVKGSYALFDSVTFNALYYLGELIDNPNPADSSSQASHVLVDLMWKF